MLAEVRTYGSVDARRRSVAEGSFGPVVVRRRLGSELRRLRGRAEMSLEQAARALEVSPSKISRLDSRPRFGTSPPCRTLMSRARTKYAVER
ncbi:helix-turn-helix domain-containing protein [Actinomycetospora sp. C-140]